MSRFDGQSSARDESRVVGWAIVGSYELGLRIHFKEWHDMRIEEQRTILERDFISRVSDLAMSTFA